MIMMARKAKKEETQAPETKEEATSVPEVIIKEKTPSTGVEQENIVTEKDIKEVEKERKPLQKSNTEAWVPKTEIGKKVKTGEITNIDEILDAGKKILEFQMVDVLFPALESDLLMIGQSKGKFGGGKRRAFRQTQKKTKEGNKPKFTTCAVIGNRDGYVGMGYGKAKETVPAREKAFRNANMTEKQFRDFTRKNIVIKTLLEQEVFGKIKVSEVDAKKFYEENLDKFKINESFKASHILIGVDAKATPEEKKKAKVGNLEAQKSDEDFLEALEYGMPPTAGFGMSERLFAMVADKSVRETVFFPLLRPEGQKNE